MMKLFSRRDCTNILSHFQPIFTNQSFTTQHSNIMARFLNVSICNDLANPIFRLYIFHFSWIHSIQSTHTGIFVYICQIARYFKTVDHLVPRIGSYCPHAITEALQNYTLHRAYWAHSIYDF